MKTAIEIIASEETYANLSTFESIEQLNETIRHYKDMIDDMELRQDLKRNLTTVLEYIKRHSCSFFGVSWKGKRKIAKDLGMSDKTVTRLCKRLESLGIIKQYAMKRSSDMQQTSNAIVIQPETVQDIPENLPGSNENVRQDGAKMSDQENKISLKQKINNIKDTANMLDSSFLAGKIPMELYNAMSPYLNAEELYNTYGILLRAKASRDRSIRIEDHAKDYIDAFKMAVLLYKQGKIRNFNGYLYSAWQTVTVVIKRRQRAGQNAVSAWFAEYMEDAM